MGNKAYVEFRGEATQLNGKPYNNQYLWIMIFDDQGHAQEIREYLDTNEENDTNIALNEKDINQ